MTRAALPNRRPNITVATAWRDHAIRITVGFDLDGNPREVFADTERGGAMQDSLADAAVLISIALQHDIPAAELAKSIGNELAWRAGEQVELPASPVGTIMAVVMECGV